MCMQHFLLFEAGRGVSMCLRASVQGICDSLLQSVAFPACGAEQGHLQQAEEGNKSMNHAKAVTGN